jgi:hypothetical protein
MSKFYRKLDGTYMGEVMSDDGDESPPESWGEVVEVPYAPEHYTQVWHGFGWEPYVPVLTIAERLEAIFFTQPLGLQIMFSGPMGLCEKYLQKGLMDEAKAIIANVPIPSDVAADAEPVRKAMLEVFNG